MRMVESVFVLGTEELLTDVAVGEAHITSGVVAIGQMQTVHIAVSALAVEHGSARSGRRDRDVPNDSVVPKRHIEFVEKRGAGIAQLEVDDDHEIREGIIPVVGLHLHLDVHWAGVLADGNARSRDLHIGVGECGNVILMRNRLKRVIRIVLKAGSFAELTAWRGGELKTCPSGCIALWLIVGRGAHSDVGTVFQSTDPDAALKKVLDPRTRRIFTGRVSAAIPVATPGVSEGAKIGDIQTHIARSGGALFERSLCPQDRAEKDEYGGQESVHGH